MEFENVSKTAGTAFKVAVARLDDSDYSLEFWGFPDVDEMQDWIEGEIDIEPLYLGSYMGSEPPEDVDIGTILIAPDEYGHFAIVNRGKKELFLEETGSDVTRIFETIFNPGGYPSLILADLDVPALVKGYDDAFLTPATAQLLETDLPISMLYPDPIELKYDGSTIRLVYDWAATILNEENFEVGITQGIESSDLTGTSSVIDTILDYGYISGYVDPDRDFNILYAPDTDGIVRISVDTPNPEYDGEKVCGFPMVVQFSFPGNLIDTYNYGLAEELELELPANPTDEEIIQVIKEALYLEKDWGPVQGEISLDNDAVNAWVEERDAVYLSFRLHILMVDGGSPGEWENASIGGQSYLVIYDGDNDGNFVDPLTLLSLSEEGEPSGIGGVEENKEGSGGCSLGLISPLFMLLVLPLLFIIKR